MWCRITRPRAPGWDEWTHRAHDPANTFGSQDTLAGRTSRPHWVSDYRPGLSSAAVAVAGGRVVLASLSYASLPETTPHIQVLDAYTGRRAVGPRRQEGAAHRPPARHVQQPRDRARDMAVAGDDLYLLGGKFCHVFDLETGKLKQSLAVPARPSRRRDDVWLYLALRRRHAVWRRRQVAGRQGRTGTRCSIAASAAPSSPWTGTAARLGWVSRTPRERLLPRRGRRAFLLLRAGPEPARARRRDGRPQSGRTTLTYQAGTEIAGCSFYRDKVWLLYNQPLAGRTAKATTCAGPPCSTSGHNKRRTGRLLRRRRQPPVQGRFWDDGRGRLVRGRPGVRLGTARRRGDRRRRRRHRGAEVEGQATRSNARPAWRRRTAS